MWVIVKVPDGETLQTMLLTDGNSLYQPEQNVLAFGAWGMADIDQSSPSVQLVEGQSKAMRKMQAGDSLQFAVLANTGTATEIRGTVQFFCKS